MTSNIQSSSSSEYDAWVANVLGDVSGEKSGFGDPLNAIAHLKVFNKLKDAIYNKDEALCKSEIKIIKNDKLLLALFKEEGQYLIRLADVNKLPVVVNKLQNCADG